MQDRIQTQFAFLLLLPMTFDAIILEELRSLRLERILVRQRVALIYGNRFRRRTVAKHGRKRSRDEQEKQRKRSPQQDKHSTSEPVLEDIHVVTLASKSNLEHTQILVSSYNPQPDR